jgi:hypothetical protein
VIFIDGKNKNDDGMVIGNNNNDVGSFKVGSELVIDGKNNQEAMMLEDL